MDIEGTIRGLVGEIITTRTGRPPRNLELERRPLGGDEATETALVTVRYQDQLNRSAAIRFVLKRLDGRPAREAAIYRDFVAVHAPGLAPQMFSVAKLGPESALIILEAVRRANAWPWRNASATSAMLTRLGAFHTTVQGTSATLPEWDFDRELADMAASACSLLDRCRTNPDVAKLARHVPTLERIAQAMPRLRRQLFAEQPFGCTPIHGDVHPGNALMRLRKDTYDPVLVDWGRARLGSPLEDVSSWLQSLRFWEAEAQRLHDTLFQAYLSAFGMPRILTSDIRAAYWIAGASNALAGALLHHLAIALDPAQRKAARATSFRAAHDWLRIVRRAHAWTM